MSALTFRYVALTDVGLRRSNNEDSGFASERVLVVADGMGGAAAGDLASSEAVHILRQLDRELDGDALTALQESVQSANSRLGDLIADDPSVEGMGTTIEAMVWDGDKIAYAHLGDSRSYRLRDGELTQISVDHSFVQSLVEEGKLTPAEARVHPHRSLLLRAMLGRDDNAPDLSWIQPQQGDRYLLCSDGLSDMLDDDAIAAGLRLETIDVAATELVRAALEAGGVDNVTVVIAEFVASDDETDGEESSADRQPQLVGAASELTRPPTGRAPGARGVATRSMPPSSRRSRRSEPAPVDEEELRYAAQPPSGRRWVRWLLGTVVIAGLVAGAAYGAYRWSQTQYYVAEDDGRVAVFKGVQLDLPGVQLNEIVRTTQIDLDDLPSYQRQQVEDGIDASSRTDANSIVSDLSEAAPTKTPKPTKTPTKTPSPTKTPKR